MAGGIPVVEVTATIPGWDDVVLRLRAAHPETLIGVGTVVSRRLARRAIAVGADFLVSPATVPEVASEAASAGIPLVSGVLTPTELFAAAPGSIVKLFPASVGGIGYLKALRALKPLVRILPTGGVSLAQVPEWKAAGAFAVGVGVKSAAQASSLVTEVGLVAGVRR